jgi:hypothetical protein
MVVPLVPRSKGLEKVLMNLTIATGLINLFNDLVALHEDKETAPNKVSIAGSLS